MRVVAVRRGGVACPVFQNRHHIFPSGFEFVAAVEEGELAVDDVQQQAFVSFGAAAFEDFSKSAASGTISTLLPAPGASSAYRGVRIRSAAIR